MTGFWTSWTKEDGDSIGKFFSSDTNMSAPEAIAEKYRETFSEPYNKIGWSSNDMNGEDSPERSEMECKVILCDVTGCAGKRLCGVHWVVFDFLFLPPPSHCPVSCIVLVRNKKVHLHIVGTVGVRESSARVFLLTRLCVPFIDCGLLHWPGLLLHFLLLLVLFACPLGLLGSC